MARAYLTPTPSIVRFWKHLRKYGKRAFWKRERKAAKEVRHGSLR